MGENHHGFFSLTDRFVGQKIGDAARAGAFDWEHEKVKPLVELVDEKL